MRHDTKCYFQMQLTKFCNKAYYSAGRNEPAELTDLTCVKAFFGLNVHCSSAYDIQDGKSLNHF